MKHRRGTQLQFTRCRACFFHSHISAMLTQTIHSSHTKQYNLNTQLNSFFTLPEQPCSLLTDSLSHTISNQPDTFALCLHNYVSKNCSPSDNCCIVYPEPARPSPILFVTPFCCGFIFFPFKETLLSLGF